jgi:Bacterial protein of unknown function (DUF922)
MGGLSAVSPGAPGCEHRTRGAGASRRLATARQAFTSRRPRITEDGHLAKRRRLRARHDDREQFESAGPNLIPAARLRDDDSGARSAEDEATDHLLQEAGHDPDRIADRLGAVDRGTQVRALTRLQEANGNAFVQGIVRAVVAGRRGGAVASGVGAGLSRTTTVTLERSIGDGAGHLDVQRDDDDSYPEEAQELQDKAASGAVEAIGPPTSTTYDITATTLADAAAAISSRSEAGHVGWVLDWKYTAGKGVIDTVSVTADITLEMPAWTPPSTMLPRARAEWNRWYAALLAHEQGHIDLVHTMFDGLAAKLLGKTPAKGSAMFEAARAKLATDSAAYDKTTDHGKKTGTVMDVSIEDKEIEEEKKKQEEAKKKGTEKTDAGSEGAQPSEVAPPTPAAG